MLSKELLLSVKLLALDFDGVLTDNTVSVNQEGVESVRCWRSDGLGIQRVRQVGIEVLIISTEVNPVVTIRAGKLKIPCKQAIEDKASAIKEICTEMGIDLQHVMFVGNDINDIPALALVGAPVAVADAYPETFEHVVYRTEKCGGKGAVREICDILYYAHKSDTQISAQ